MKTKNIYMLVFLCFSFTMCAKDVNGNPPYKNSTFEKLATDEVLMYKTYGSNGRTMDIYAVENNSKRLIVSQLENTNEWGELQFTGNQRNCFVAVMNTKDRTKDFLYFVDGEKGQVRYLKQVSGFRTTLDGMYLIHQKESNSDPLNGLDFMIYDVKSEKEIKSLHWNIDNLNQNNGIQLIRDIDGKAMRILILAEEGSYIIAAASIDLSNLTLIPLWDYRNTKTKIPSREDVKYTDDVDVCWEPVKYFV